VPSYLFLCCAGDETQGLLHARQAAVPLGDSALRLYFFKEHFSIPSKIGWKAQIFLMYQIVFYPQHTQPCPWSMSPARVVHLFLTTNLHWHIIARQSPQLTLQFILGMGLDLWVASTRWSVIQSIFTHPHPPQFSALHLFTPSLPPLTSSNHWPVSITDFAFSRKLDSHSVYSFQIGFFHLVTWLPIPPGLFVAW
jgi:hypothetical protein